MRKQDHQHADPRETRPGYDPVPDIERALRRYVELVETDRAIDLGWPNWINIPSKVAQVAALRLHAAATREEAERGDRILAAVCPGLVNTEASRPWFSDMSQAQSPAEAAEDVSWLATVGSERRDLHGELVQHRRVLDFVSEVE